MSNKVVKFYPKNAAKDPNAVLEQSIDQYQDVFVIGWNNDDTLDIRASLGINGREMLWLLQLVTHKLMNGDYNE